MSDLRYDLTAIRKARSNKYDLMLKDLVSLDQSSLATLLGVDGYGVESIEFAEHFAERADAVYRHGDCIVHVEFQTKNEADLSWRMLEYYVRIVVTHGRRDAPHELSVRQVILYIGTPRSAPHDGFDTPNLTFKHEWRDVREFGGHAADLLNSRFPDDWLLGVLCMPRVNDRTWKAIAARIPKSPMSLEAFRLARAKLLLIANLRGVDEGLIQELIELSTLFNVKDSNALRALADEILEEDTALSLLRAIGRVLEALKTPMTREQREELASFDRDALESFLVVFTPTRNVAEAIDAARHSSLRFR